MTAIGEAFGWSIVFILLKITLIFGYQRTKILTNLAKMPQNGWIAQIYAHGLLI